MNKHMRVVTNQSQGHENIPEGYACIYMDGHGWVGTGDGNVMGSSPALFPVHQADALAYSWGHTMRVGVKLFERSVSREEVNSFKGLALFPFEDSDEVVGWLTPDKQMV